MVNTKIATNPIEEKISAPGAKHILALDGGGVRGIISIAYLEAIEEVLSERYKKRVLLSDHFHLVGGTSTGAIIASALALGHTAAQVRDLYFRLAPQVFRRPRWNFTTAFRPKFDGRRLLRQIKAIVGDETLESERLLTGLCIICKRFDNNYTWVVTNNPRSRYWHDHPESKFVGNRRFPLAQLIRASAAAPYYFGPEYVELVAGTARGLFLDGGVTPHNTPALQLLFVAILEQYGFNWQLGPDRLHITSVGTGSRRQQFSIAQAKSMGNVRLAISALAGMIQENQDLVLQVMQLVGRSPDPFTINSEIAALERRPFDPILSFVRYDLPLKEGLLDGLVDERISETEAALLTAIDEPRNLGRCYDLARKASAKQVRAAHFSFIS
jgi:hypothetical protein